MNQRIDKTVRASRVAGIPGPMVRLVTAKWLRAIAAACGMALLLSATTALDTASLPFFGRTAYWLMEMLLGAAIIGAILWLLKGLPRRRLYLRTAIVALVGAPLITIAVWATTELVIGRPLHWERVLVYLPGVLPLTGFNAFVQILLGRRELDQDALTSETAMAGPRNGVEPTVYALEAQAHYVVFHTSDGTSRKLLRFYDAIASVARTTAGLQIHRSWWVAETALVRFDEKGRSILLINGLYVPVSRANLAAARALFNSVPSAQPDRRKHGK